MRKYGETEEAVVEYGERARAEVARLMDTEQERARRQAESERLGAAALDAAAKLHGARENVAATLSRGVTERLVEIGFPSAAFEVSLQAAPLDQNGVDAVTFLLAPNPGEPARSLARIASGGEMSRVALALKAVLARADETPTLVFDEVDAGIGGRSADPVGGLLWRLARDHQVICITHLAQIAAYADQHMRIEKTERDGRTVTQVQLLDSRDARVAELAQMLGGPAASIATQDAARALLDASAARTGELAVSGR
jgi:DNA repair protein RecN (Recombination protein N)